MNQPLTLLALLVYVANATLFLGGEMGLMVFAPLFLVSLTTFGWALLNEK